MTRDDLQSVLQQPYHRDRWIQTLCAVLPGTEIFGLAQPVEASTPQAREICQLGRIRLAGDRNLAALDITLNPTPKSGFRRYPHERGDTQAPDFALCLGRIVSSMMAKHYLQSHWTSR